MTKIVIYAILFLAILIAFSLLQKRGGRAKNEYQYKRRGFFLSRAEHECYDALVAAVGSEYHIFAQVHLPTLVDNKVIGQNWLGAFRHINGKSVDFVLCDKAYIAPKLAIELDDRTHERQDRIERDEEVERVLKGAGLPLLRLENHGGFNPSELAQKIELALSK